MIAVIIILAIIGVFLAYKFVSKRPLPTMSTEEVCTNREKVLLDLRDYNVSYKSPLKGSYNIPSAYLKRYFSELPKQDLVIATEQLKYVRADVRFLQKQGFNIVGVIEIDEESTGSLTICEC